MLLAGREANAGGGRGTAVCDVEAPPDACWKAVLGFDRYAGRLAQCSKSTVYERKKNVMARTETIKVHMKLAGGVKTFNCYYDHTFRPDKNTARRAASRSFERRTRRRPLTARVVPR